MRYLNAALPDNIIIRLDTMTIKIYLKLNTLKYSQYLRDISVDANGHSRLKVSKTLPMPC